MTNAKPVELEHCPICVVAFKSDDICATDIEMGICHAACLEGAPTVNLDTGEPSDGPIATYRYDSLDEPVGLVTWKRFDLQITEHPYSSSSVRMIETVSGSYVLHSEASALISKLTAERDALADDNADNIELWHAALDRAEAAEKRVKELETERDELRSKLFPYADETEISGISWKGFYLIGNKKSIGEFRELENKASQIEVYKSEYDRRALAAEDANKLLSERVAVLEGALEPFAAFVNALAASNPGWDHDEFTVFVGEHHLTLAPFRRARTGLEGK